MNPWMQWFELIKKQGLSVPVQLVSFSNIRTHDAGLSEIAAQTGAPLGNLMVVLVIGKQNVITRAEITSVAIDHFEKSLLGFVLLHLYSYGFRQFNCHTTLLECSQRNCVDSIHANHSPFLYNLVWKVDLIVRMKSHDRLSSVKSVHDVYLLIDRQRMIGLS